MDKIQVSVIFGVDDVAGVDSMSIDTKDKKLTVTGNVDPVELVSKLKKLCHTEILSVGPAKEPEKKKDEPKKEDAKKAAVAPAAATAAIKAYPAPVLYQYQYQQPYPHYPTPVPAYQHYYISLPLVVSQDEGPLGDHQWFLSVGHVQGVDSSRDILSGYLIFRRIKVVLKLEYLDDKVKQKVMKKVSGVEGVDSVSIETKDKKLTVTGNVDPVELVTKLKKLCHTEILSVGPAKEAEKKKEEPKKEEAKKPDEKKKEAAATKAYSELAHYHYQYQRPYPHYPTPVPARYQHHYSVEEDPNSCVIC
ncbi:hypothetical protein MTR67_027384 [Solanum verrucosum]|uniref:HMA domain-containing protein n=1 Tax=Solanum verrucosum TaxID=315347 RepID=A0AAF0TVN1_SOLVR|nr:hypothetical protein MTR67_027384 [Solanum verrucosum]